MMWCPILLLCMSLATRPFLGQCADSACDVDVECYTKFGSLESYVSVLQNTLGSLKSKLDEMQRCRGNGSKACPKCPEWEPVTCATCPDVNYIDCPVVTCPVPACPECPNETAHPEFIAKSLPSDCSEYLQAGYNRSGIYKIRPVHFTVDEPVDVYCDMDTDGGGWTVFQRRDDYGEPRQDFFLGWEDYKRGFGNLSKEFWLGNDNLHALTNQKKMSLRIDLEDFDGVRVYVAYEGFLVRSEEELYNATFWNFSGENGMTDSMTLHTNNTNFSTKDRDNDKYSGNCANQFKGGWWYGFCHGANLNGLYLKGRHESYANGVNWSGWKGQYYSLKLSEMKVRPKGFQKNRP